MIQKQDLRSPQNAPWTPRSAAMTMGSFSVRSAVVRTSARWDKSACVTRKSLPGFADSFFFLLFTKKTFLCDAYVESWNVCFWWLLATFAKTCGGQRGRRALVGTACVMPPEYKQYHCESLLSCLSVSGGMELLNGTNFDKQIQLDHFDRLCLFATSYSKNCLVSFSIVERWSGLLKLLCCAL